MMIRVKIVVQVKLMPDAVQAPAIAATLRTVNDRANWVSGVAFEHGVPREYELRKHTYAELKASGLGAQAAQQTIKKVRDAYTALKANIRAGNLGKPGSKRRTKAESKPISFRPQAAHPFDDRCLSWQYDARTVSIWTTAGRLRNVRFDCSADALKTLREHRKGESDLIERDGVFYLIAVCEIPETPINENPFGFIGVDLGIVNIATTYRLPGRRTRLEPAPQAAARLAPQTPDQGHPVRQTSVEAPQPQGTAAHSEHQSHHLEEDRHHR